MQCVELWSKDPGKHPVPLDLGVTGAHWSIRRDDSAGVDIPCGHGRHETVPLLPAYDPLGHAAHAERPVASAIDPAGHCEQDVCPEVLATQPATHGVQAPTPAEAEYVPGLQGVHCQDPDSAYVPAGHVLHVDALVAPMLAENCPAGHWAHALLPGDTEYEPAGHSSQTDSFMPPA
jgi:hypothetical protein